MRIFCQVFTCVIVLTCVFSSVRQNEESTAAASSVTAHDWNARFFESTRGRIVDLLRRQRRTVDELAKALGLTDNAVRLHLIALERDSIVRAIGVRREGAVGKPATFYEVTAEAEPQYSRAYLPFLTALLATLGDRLTSDDLRDLMREVGHRLAGTAPATAEDLLARTELASGILNALGGITTVERDGESLRIQGCGCPLAVAVTERQEVCASVQTMLADVIGAPVAECCDRSDRPRCRFEVAGTSGAGSTSG
jgi:predicted ArsR family transcriptional regulator